MTVSLPNSSFMSTMFKADLEGKTSKYGCKHSHKIYHGQLFFWSDDSVKGKETLKIYTYRDSEVNKQKPTTIIKQPPKQTKKTCKVYSIKLIVQT